MELTKEKLLEMYRRMVTIRLFESSLQPYYEQDHIPCSAHLSIGEEAVSVGACSALGERDYILSTHRGHGHVLARGANMLSTAAEIFTKATGCTGGKGGTQHLSDLNSYVLATNGITGGGIALAGGAGLSMKMQKTGQVCLCFFGDGASNRGATVQPADGGFATIPCPVAAQVQGRSATPEGNLGIKSERWGLRFLS